MVYVCMHRSSVSTCECVCSCSLSTNSWTLFWSRQRIFHTKRCYIDCISPKPPLIRVTMIHIWPHICGSHSLGDVSRELRSYELSSWLLFLLSFNYSFCHVYNKSLLGVRALSYMHIQTLPSRCHGWTITFFISFKCSPRISKKDPSRERKSSWGYQ